MRLQQLQLATNSQLVPMMTVLPLEPLSLSLPLSLVNPVYSSVVCLGYLLGLSSVTDFTSKLKECVFFCSNVSLEVVFFAVEHVTLPFRFSRP